MMKNEEKGRGKSLKIILLFLGAALGLFLIIYGGNADGSGGSEVKESEDLSIDEMDAERYARESEERIAELCRRVRGAGEVKVFVTLSCGYTAVYAQNSQSSASGYKNEFVITGSGSSERPLLVGYSVPQISGIGIVCTGGGNASVRQEMISLVSAAYGVSSNKIYVAEAQS
ncbi:MAG: hypothetical protein J6Q77_04210 [Clostridia bacterium]|nr:hypothetical protein [Clostridia bacterium]